MHSADLVSASAVRGCAPTFLDGGGELGALMRAHDWASTSLGSAEDWPEGLRSALGLCLDSAFPIAIYWGRELRLLYNDAWRPILGDKHPWALGRPAHEVWPEIWDEIKPVFDRVFATGTGVFNGDSLLAMKRYGYVEECYFDYTFNPIRAGGTVAGIFNVVIETTYRVISARRAQVQRDFAARLSGAQSIEDVIATAAASFAENSMDVAFALLYRVSPGASTATLAQSVRLKAGTAGWQEVALDTHTLWPLANVARSGRAEQVGDLATRFGPLPGGHWPEAPREALVLPVCVPGHAAPPVLLVAGVSPRRALDLEYRAFFESLAAHMASAIATAQAFESERRRAEALAELDRAKTAFFSNVSHEFRTPLTLMLGPVEDILAKPSDEVLAPNRAALEVVHRNGQRLLKLVNTLLDFARIEAGRAQACFEPTDLAALTAELASNFRSACEHAGLRLTVKCLPSPEPAYVDREMWEKIVLNLVSNAFKFTLKGEIAVSLRRSGGAFELVVRDTGTGIPEAALPRLFERFHRVEGARGRSHEGSGIGLALVQELVKFHGGSIVVESVCGQGTAFTVSIPAGRAHLPGERISAPREAEFTAVRAGAYIEEAMSWLPSRVAAAADPSSGPRVLLADDNADLREYARRMLAERYDVEAAADGEAALQAARVRKPDLIVTDVMMPRLDGFGLIRELRADPDLCDVPVIVLTARAGEEARIEGLGKGADDYLAKPFSARELIVRSEALLRSAEIRRKAQEALRASEERYRQVLGLMPAGVYTCEAPSGFISFFNEHAVTLWGRAPRAGDNDERFCGSYRLWRPDGTVLPHDRTPMALAMREGRSFRNEEVVIERPNGSRITVLVNIDPLRDARGRTTGAINVFHDVTERKIAEERLRRSEQELSDFFETAAVGLHWVGPDGIIQRANRAELEMLGYAREDYVGRHIAEFHVDRAVIDDILARLTRGERLHDYPAQMRCGDGSIRDVLISSSVLFAHGEFVHTRCFTLDVTARKRVEATLQARARQQQAIASLGELALRERDLQKVFEHATAVAARALGVEYSKVLELLPQGREVLLRAGVGWQDGLVGTARVSTGVESQAGYTLLADAPVVVADLRSEQRFSGPPLLIEHGVVSGMSCIIRGAEGAAWGVLGTHSTRKIEFTDDDVSFLTAVANVLGHAIQRDRAEAALRESDRHKDEFIAMLSHELRNPLAPLRSALELLRLKGASAPAEVQPIMERQVKHLVRLVDDLLEMSRISRGLLELRREPVRLEDVVRSAIESSEPLIREAGHHLEVELPSESLWLEGDPVRLAQVFANLLNNAARYTSRGGQIGVRAARGAQGCIEVSVRDSGAGLSAEAKARLFEMFSRGKGSTGLGIGLALVRRLVEMHGGSVQAVSEGEGCGSEFIVSLPLGSAPAAAAAPGASGQPAICERYRVLVADDNRDAAESLALLLRALGNEVSVAYDGEQAVEAARIFQPHVVLLDIGMPKLDGYEAARRIRRDLSQKIRIVALTGWGQDEDRRRAREAGFDEHLVKPAELDKLRSVLAAIQQSQSM